MIDDPTEPTAPLPYAAPNASGRRVSRLAMAAIPAGVLCCPCLLSALVQPIMTHLPRGLIDAGLFSWMRNWGVFTLMAATTAVPIAALVRVSGSHGRRTGIWLGVTGLALSLLWWLLVLTVRFRFAAPAG